MSGGGAGSGGSGSSSSGGTPTGSGGRGSGGYPPPGGSGRPPRQQPPNPGDRPISFQSEDRYWTDYLRVILPVVGLLLLLGLFWYWASTLIGDDDNEPGATPSQAAVVITQAAPSPTPTGEAAITPQETSQAAGDNQTGDNQNAGQETPASGQETATEEATTADAAAGKFAEGDVVVVNDDGVNLRSDPSTESDAVELMSLGTELRITGASEDAEDYTWWPVEDEASGLSGWVAEDFIDPSG